MGPIVRLIAGAIPAFFLLLFGLALNDLTSLVLSPVLLFYGAVVFVIGFALLTKRMEIWAERHLIKKNKAELEAWVAAGHVSPDTVRDSIFLVKNDKKQCIGTAFMLADGTIVSNRHVVDGATAVFLQNHAEYLMNQASGALFPQGEYVRVRHVADPLKGPDMAILNGTAYVAKGMPGLPIATELPKPGDKLLIVGQNGRRARFHQTVVTVDEVGIQGKLRPKKSLLARYMWSIYFFFFKLKGGEAAASGTRFGLGYAYRGDCSYGNSGSPVVNTKGEVVGINYAGHPYYIFASDCIGFGAGIELLNTELEKAKNNPTPKIKPKPKPKVDTIKLYFEWESRYGRFQ